jgi:hypothetical protein
MHSKIGVPYNNGPHFATNHSLLQEISQHYAITNIINPSFYDLVGSPQAIQPTTFMRQKTNVHLKQAQVNAKDSMLATTSTLAQSQCEWSKMQTHMANSHLTIAQESQIAAITASVRAATVVAKVAMEAAKAIEEASKEFLGQLRCPSQASFGKSKFANSAKIFAHGQGNIVEMTNFQPKQFQNTRKINTIRKTRKSHKIGASTTTSKDALLSSRSREKTIKFMKQEVVTEEKNRMEEGGCEMRTIHRMDRIEHVELKDPRCEVFKCTQGVSIGLEPNELVEVMTGEVGLQGGWFVAQVLMKTNMEAFV